MTADSTPTAAAPTHAVRHVRHDLPARVAPGRVFLVNLTVENAGSIPWRASSPAGDHVGLAVHWDGKVVANHVLPSDVAPGGSATLHFAVEAPLEPGEHRLALEMVQYKVSVFSDRGSPALVSTIVVEDAPVERTARLWSLAQKHDAWHYLPTRGVERARDGTPFPVFVERAQGCRLWDTNRRRYVDYTMGWGSVLLGYSHPKVTEALVRAASSGPTISWPQPVEVELAAMLAEDFRPDGMVCFAKNGSDACTFAARMARAFTGRKTILFSGYHGWQDFWVEQVGFGRTGVAPREPALIHRFPFHDLASFQELFAQHRHDLAAVMVEPSPWAGDGLGFEPDSDPVFLRAVADAARAAGALFVLDEIVTGYRYPGHSVQRAKGVQADLVCVGKAIASGSPLSAVVGRADVFKEALPRAFYAATFHGEAHSFAAAKATIEVYRSEPVAAHVWDYGRRMQDGVHALCRELGVDASFRGTPWRMNFQFGASGRELLQLRRTLFQQELLKAGVTTYNGVMLPCYAHDDAALAETLAAFGRALEVVADADRRGDHDARLEIPPLIDL